MTSNTQKAYQRGKRMGEYIRKRDGAGKALERGSKADRVYAERMHGLMGAYSKGYQDGVRG